MSEPIISVDHLAKMYLLGENLYGRGVRTFRDQFDYGMKRLFSRSARKAATQAEQELWALSDVSFEVPEGQVVGIIGRNGAGKSTLLKVLSRITEPTRGTVRLRGRVASLLEVGTGFNMELTGRENIFLNGAILGMRKSEILRKFDEIVAFAEVEKFIDTPVKRYSSGMYLRLAFAVAAHLDPEILIVDEVLAVGDAEFQKKCLGKMQDIALRQGRTVIFVSHNMQAVTNLCERAIQLKRGCVVQDGEAVSTVRNYMLTDVSRCGEVTWDEGLEPGDELLRVKAVRLLDDEGNIKQLFNSRERIRVQIEFDLARADRALVVGFDLTTAEGTLLLRSYHTDTDPGTWPDIRPGRNTLECELPASLFNTGTYLLNLRISLHNVRWLANVDSVLMFNIEFGHGNSEYLNNPDRRKNGIILPVLPWTATGTVPAGDRSINMENGLAE